MPTPVNQREKDGRKTRFALGLGYKAVLPGILVKLSEKIVFRLMPTQDLVGVCYRATLASETSRNSTQVIDPVIKAKARLASIQSADDLLCAEICLPNRSLQKIMDRNGLKAKCQAAVEAIKQLVKIQGILPEDGTPSQQGAGSNSASAMSAIAKNLGITFESLRSFLGFMFNWGDIVRTHKVFKNILTKYVLHTASRITGFRDFTSSVLDSLEGQLDAWAGIMPESESGKSLGSMADKSSTENPALADPQTHYLQDKLKAGISSAEATTLLQDTSDDDDEQSDWRKVLGDLQTLAALETETLKKTIDKIKTEIIDKLDSDADVAVGELVLSTAKNIAVATLDIVKDLTTAVLNALDEHIKIPVISRLYRDISGGSELSIMDLSCLVAAVPATLLLKAVTGRIPFPEGDYTTTQLVEAPDFATIRGIMSSDATKLKDFTILSQFISMTGLGLSALANTVRLPWMLKGGQSEVSHTLKQIVPSVGQIVAYHNGTRLDGSVANKSRTSNYTALATSLAYVLAVMTGPLVWSPALEPESKLAVLADANGVMVAAAVGAVTAGVGHGDD
ncbi:hypothetical protein LZ30DRAFT_689963 [Colletotrichum cereale]|nr:hypothetical protein LZ30DRAFT_689963 [Colletotrichum cereale]